jgi:hypothetical protein
VAEANLCCDSSSFVEVINELIVIQGVVVDVFGLQDPFEIEARRFCIFILNPATLFQSSLYIRVTASADENFHIIINFVLLFPRSQIGYVWEYHLFGVISLKE